jgi:hypothetical protein
VGIDLSRKNMQLSEIKKILAQANAKKRGDRKGKA